MRMVFSAKDCGTAKRAKEIADAYAGRLMADGYAVDRTDAVDAYGECYVIEYERPYGNK